MYAFIIENENKVNWMSLLIRDKKYALDAK